MTDYYEVLGVDRNSTPEEIKKKYREKVKKYHPDRYTDPELRKAAEEKFKEIQEAYDVLSDSRKKSTYDVGGNVSNSRNRSDYGSYDYYLTTIQSYLQRRQYENAERVAVQTIKMNPERYEAYMFLGLTHYSTRNFTRACVDFEKSESRGMKQHQFFAVYGVCLRETGQYNRAVDKFNRAIELDGDNPNYFANLAITYELLKDKNMAEIYWSKVRELDPNSPYLKQKNYRENFNTIGPEATIASAACCLCSLLSCCCGAGC